MTTAYIHFASIILKTGARCVHTPLASQSLRRCTQKTPALEVKTGNPNSPKSVQHCDVSPTSFPRQRRPRSEVPGATQEEHKWIIKLPGLTEA
ncbi:hypothetical protein AVEN_26705-1 [Araneus ventricosus]|uniref:Uncharacterized protein n=1 Tax=Araneus ventricosus TaxID=182803 RepID=A0A4Y2Q0B7_ARAVE|nr:hypothetical protein AVEN_26705-1 [Araneus ventricosus]